MASVDVQTKSGKWLLDRNPAVSQLIEQTWDAPSNRLTVKRQVGEWELEESVVLGMVGNSNRIARYLRLVYRPDDGHDNAAKFFRVRFAWPLAKQGDYFIPMRGVLDENRRVSCTDLSAQSRTASGNGLGALLIEQTAQRTLLFLNDPRRDSAQTVLVGSDNPSCYVAQEFNAAGWAEAGQAQSIGPAFMEVHAAPLEATFRTAIWKACDDLGLKVPDNRPLWVFENALYSFHPNGTIGSGFTDLGGFTAARQHLVPRVKQLGAGAIWLLPLEDRGCYWPRDYYKFQDGLGTEAEYRSLVQDIHAQGMRVWQDLVPHGGSPAFGPLRNDLPWWLVFDENGDAQNYWCFDFREPGWQDRIFKVVEHYMRSFSIDGFRVDAVGGSHIMNWRRAGFPAANKVPGNVPAAWWKASLEKIGGQVPPLPYERGSLTLREGGLQMLHGIRDTVRSAQPDGAVLGEVQRAPYMQECDVLYDFDFSLRLLLQGRRMPPEILAANAQRFLEEQRLAEPRGTLRLRYVESHDTLRAQGWVGVAAYRALLALTAWMDGMPMIYHEADTGHGPFIHQILQIRSALPELQYGEARYQAIRCDQPGVLTFLRTLGANNSIVAINLNPEAKSIQLDLPKDLPGSPQWPARNMMSGAPVAVTGTAPLRCAVRLDAWEATALCFRPPGIAVPTATPTLAELPPVRETGQTPKVTAIEDRVEVSTSNYRLTLSLASGLVQEFASADGKPLLGQGDLFVDGALENGRDIATRADYQSTPEAGGVALEFKTQLSSGARVSLRYRCRDSHVELTATLDDRAAHSRAGLVFAGAECQRYQVQTAEGLLDDWFTPRPATGKPGHSNIYYRQQGTEILWQMETVPLPETGAALRCLKADGSGAELTLAQPWQSGLANALLLDKYAGRPGWHAALLWRDLTSPKAVSPAVAAFTVTLAPGKLPVATAPLEAVTAQHHSTHWLVENAHYRAQLQRTGGTLSRLWTKQPALQLLAENQEFYTDKGFSTERMHRAATDNDVETGARIWRAGKSLHAQFHGQLRDADRFGIIQPAIRFATEYVFDDSPTIRVRLGFLSQGQAREPSAFLAWMLPLIEPARFEFLRAGNLLAAGACDKSGRMGETAKLGLLPDTVRLYNDNRQMAEISALQCQAPAPLQNVFLAGRQFFMAWLDGGGKPVVPNAWYECEFLLTPGAAKAARPSAIVWPTTPKTTSELLADASFESTSSAHVYSLREKRALPLGSPNTPTARPWQIPPRREHHRGPRPSWTPLRPRGKPDRRIPPLPANPARARTNSRAHHPPERLGQRRKRDHRRRGLEDRFHRREFSDPGWRMETPQHRHPQRHLRLAKARNHPDHPRQRPQPHPPRRSQRCQRHFVAG